MESYIVNWTYRHIDMVKFPSRVPFNSSSDHSNFIEQDKIKEMFFVWLMCPKSFIQLRRELRCGYHLRIGRHNKKILNRKWSLYDQLPILAEIYRWYSRDENQPLIGENITKNHKFRSSHDIISEKVLRKTIYGSQLFQPLATRIT